MAAPVHGRIPSRIRGLSWQNGFATDGISTDYARSR
jgi:hypothetical protein